MYVGSMMPAEFGQIAEQVIEGRGTYDEQTQRDVWVRASQMAEVVGRTKVFNIVRDGEVGVQVYERPVTDDDRVVRPRHVIDPIAFGV
jgi:hypothetical protein